MPRYAAIGSGSVNEPRGEHIFHALKSGQEVALNWGPEGQNKPLHVRYDSEPSYGDNGKQVPGATVGRYTVTYPNGKTSVHEHGPHASTDRAAKMGANPNAKQSAAYRAHDEVARHVLAAHRGFNDRR